MTAAPPTRGPISTPTRRAKRSTRSNASKRSAPSGPVDASRANQRISTLCVAAVSALNIILFVLLFRNLGTQLGTQSREQQRLLHMQTELDALVRERTRQLEALARHLQNIGEEEKTKLARELHDELGAILTATKIRRRLGTAAHHGGGPHRGRQARAGARPPRPGHRAKRRIIEDMRPTVLAHFGLVTALRTLAEEAAQRNGWQLSLGLPEDDVRLDEAHAIALFRVAQEALNNAAKYARASRLEVRLRLPAATATGAAAATAATATATTAMPMSMPTATATATATADETAAPSPGFDRTRHHRRRDRHRARRPRACTHAWSCSACASASPRAAARSTSARAWTAGARAYRFACRPKRKTSSHDA
ncbi:MAG: hypothetical protein WDN30_15820 [Pararobbsia sp.]